MYLIHDGRELVSFAGEGILFDADVQELYIQTPGGPNAQELGYIVKFNSPDFQVQIDGKMQDVDPDTEYFCLASGGGFSVLNDILLTQDTDDEE